jgi:hypothetical protein
VRRIEILVALCLAVTACGGAPPGTTASVATRQAAIEYASSADRALDGTRFSDVGVTEIADAVVAVCTDTGPLGGAVGDAIASITAPAGAAVDDEILAEVLTEGAREVCPERSGVDEVIRAYLDAVRSAVASADASAAVDDQAVLGAGPVACDLLDRDQGPEAALLGVVAALFGVEASSVADLETVLSASQGVVAGATLAAAAAHLCADHSAEVAAYLGSLGGP